QQILDGARRGTTTVAPAGKARQQDRPAQLGPLTNLENLRHIRHLTASTSLQWPCRRPKRPSYAHYIGAAPLTWLEPPRRRAAERDEGPRTEDQGRRNHKDHEEHQGHQDEEEWMGGQPNSFPSWWSL